MPSVHPLRARRAAVALLALVALVVGTTACGAGEPPAATVEGTDISAEVVDEIVEAYVEADPETYGPEFTGAGTDTLSMAPVSNVLGSLVIQELQAHYAEQRDIEPTAEERTQAEELARTSFVQDQAAPAPDGAPSEAEQTSGAIFDALSTSTQEYLVDLRAQALALSRQLGEESGSGDAAAREFYEQNPQQFTAVCVYLLAVPADQLEAVQGRLDGGEDFAEVSAEVSTEPQVQEAAAGPPQCLALTQLQQQVQPELFEALAGAEAGDVIGPYPYDETGEIQTLFGIEERQVTPFEQVRDAILQQLPSAGDQAVSDLLLEEAPQADVSVDPRFGSWDADQARVIPPEGAVDPAGTGTDVPVEGVDAADAPG